MAATFGYWVDEVKNVVISAKCNWNYKEVAEKKQEVPQAKASKKMIENIVHWPKINQYYLFFLNQQGDLDYLLYSTTIGKEAFYTVMSPINITEIFT